jgi:hypothetical protein
VHFGQFGVKEGVSTSWTEVFLPICVFISFFRFCFCSFLWFQDSLLCLLLFMPFFVSHVFQGIVRELGLKTFRQDTSCDQRPLLSLECLWVDTAVITGQLSEAEMRSGWRHVTRDRCRLPDTTRFGMNSVWLFVLTTKL